jgi:ATP-dependent DNA helicase DinG
MPRPAPSRPVASAAMPESSIAELLGKVVALLPAGEVRDSQRKMAETVAQTLASGKHVAVTAGTGTGKSFAYLVPAVASGKRVVIATATKALQDQLAMNDLPRVAEGLKLGPKWRWAVLKGRSNYVCRQRIAEMDEFGHQETLEESGQAKPRAGSLGEQVVRLVEWSERSPSGDRSELDFEPQPRAWAAVSVGADECPGAHRCPSGSDCFAELARAKAAQADVVVVNLHLLGADLRSGGSVLPEHDALIIDEAHELEDVLAASLGVDVSPGRLRAIATSARAALPASSERRSGPASGRGPTSSQPATVEDVMGAAIRLEEALAKYKDQRLPAGLGDGVGEAAKLAVARLARLEAELRKAATPDPAKPGDSELAQRALRSQLGVERCREELESCLTADGDEVVWVAGGERPSLRSAPLDVSRILSAQVFETMPTVLTSATLPPGLAVRLGAPAADVTEIDVGSPFDYQRNALVYCAARLPDRRRPGAEEAIHAELEELIRAAGGRTLALFTSYRAMTAAAEALRPKIPWPIYVQGDLPKPALLQAFSEEHSACLFATMGFWQGVDVPGPTLSLVVIDRLPFPRPDDPLMSARRDAAGAMGFRAVDLPRAATLLAQGAGRLVRTATDRGVVAVLDSRLATASYSGYLVKALPPMRRTKSRAEAVEFLRKIHEAETVP